MFTVLIAEKEHIEAIKQENALFFEPFLEKKDLVICSWNPQGQTLQEAVPGLLDVVGRRKEWRAVILNTDRSEQLEKQNPFDVVDYSGVQSLSQPTAQPNANEDWDAWENSWKAYFDCLMPVKEQVYRAALERPLQKLATWLCFQPTDFLLEDAQRETEDSLVGMQTGEKAEIKPNVRLERLESIQYRWQLCLKEKLRREFTGGKSINIAYPSAIYCISPRVSETGFFTPDAYWNIRSSNEYSAFSDRNMFFDKMRFLVFDMLPETHRNSRCDKIRFLYTVLVFASNEIPGGALQARKLYALDSECDEKPLCVLATSYDKKLSATYDIIEIEMERIRSEIPGALTDKEAVALFCTPTEVPVTFEAGLNPELLFAETDYGLSGDCPEQESLKWSRGYKTAKKQLLEMQKKQRRMMKKSVDKTHYLSQVPQGDISRLTAFQLEDVKEQTDNAEEEMIASTPKGDSAFSDYAQRMAEENKKVKKVLKGRMSKRRTIVSGLVCLGIYLIALLPMLLGNLSTARTQETAIVLILIALGLLAGVLLVGLFVLRAAVLRAIKGYNTVAEGILKEIQGSMEGLSRFLSAVCNVRRGRSICNYYNKNVDVYTLKLRIRKKHQEDIRKRRAYLQEFYGDFLGGSEYYDQAMIRPYELDFDQKTEFAYAPPFLTGDFRQISFLENGNLITVPTGYITRIYVRQEEIYDA